MCDLYYQNTRGLRTKTNQLYTNVLNCSYDIIVFTETWLNCGIRDSELFDSRYDLYRRDRITSENGSNLDGGGVLIAVLRDYHLQRPHNGNLAVRIFGLYLNYV
ncbi:hypothetical protein ACJJTC_013343 [Scirpophaga incertulas]